MEREFIDGKDFWISYNPNTDLGPETALCQNTRPCYLILKGNYIEDFRPIVDKGYDACLEKFNELLENGAEKSFWSE